MIVKKINANFTHKLYNLVMKKLILLIILLTWGQAREYQIVHVKKGGALNVREVPRISGKTKVGSIPAYATGITIRECLENRDGREWCYIKYPLGGGHLEGWVSSHFLSEMKEKDTKSVAHIRNFLYNFYLADSENFLDKLQVFYRLPMLQYMWKKNVPLMDLRDKKVKYYKHWPKRSYRMSYFKILKRKSRYIDIQTTVRWTISNSKESQSGKDIQKLRLLPDEGTFKVLAIKNLKHIVFPKPIEPEEKNATALLEEEHKKELLALDEKEKKKLELEALAEEKKNKNANLYYIKAGSFFSAINKKYLYKIEKTGFKYHITTQEKSKGSLLRRVYIGPFATVTQAQDALKLIRIKINKNAYMQTGMK